MKESDRELALYSAAKVLEDNDLDFTELPKSLKETLQIIYTLHEEEKRKREARIT